MESELPWSRFSPLNKFADRNSVQYMRTNKKNSMFWCLAFSNGLHVRMLAVGTVPSRYQQQCSPHCHSFCSRGQQVTQWALQNDSATGLYSKSYLCQIQHVQLYREWIQRQRCNHSHARSFKCNLHAIIMNSMA